MKNIDSRIIYYTNFQKERNFGDYLSEFYAREFLVKSLIDADVYRLIGSTINNYMIAQDLESIRSTQSRIAYWCCGMRDSDPLSEELSKHCVFLGSRGPLTSSILGLPVDTPIGDPGLLLPIVHRARPSSRTQNKTVCIPHFSQRGNHEQLLSVSGAEIALSPAIENDHQLLQLVDDIASADFVLTGSLHGAIVACAYDRPFAFWDTGFVDIPFKWADFSASIGVASSFVTTLREGQEFYEKIKSKIRLPHLAPILGCCPFVVRPLMLLKALAYDLNVPHDIADGMFAQCQKLAIEQVDFIRAIKNESNSIQKTSASVRQDALISASQATSKEMEAIALELETMKKSVERRSRYFKISVNIDSPELKFANGDAGTDCLSGSWTAPNEIGPWSLPPYGGVTLPAGAGWERAITVTFTGYMFAPLKAPLSGRRNISIWLSGICCYDENFVNTSDQHGVYATFRCQIPPPIQNNGGELDIRFYLEVVGSNLSLQIGDDHREIGFALISAVFEYP